eukprot:COSAG02_NODE_4036_length_5879_cov_4.246886_1_plen_62_part_00
MAGQTFTEAELDAAMTELDPSGDGQVDFDEFKKYWEDNVVAGGCVLQTVLDLRRCPGENIC